MGVGAERSKSIPMEIVKENRSITNNKTDVLSKWKQDFQSLYNNQYSDGVSTPGLGHQNAVNFNSPNVDEVF